MNTRPPALAANDANLIHASTCTTLSTNADPSGKQPSRVTFRVSKCEIRWLDGGVSVRFAGNTADITPRRPLATGAGR